MKRSYLYIVIIGIVLVGTGFYFFYLRPDSKTTTSLANTSITKLQAETEVNANQQQFIIKEKIADPEENKSKKIYTYRKDYRNPFKDYNTVQKDNKDIEKNSLEKIKSNLPFKLTGIIGSDRERLAVLSTGKDSYILRVGEKYDKFIMTKLTEKSASFYYQDIYFTIDVGSGKGDG